MNASDINTKLIDSYLSLLKNMSVQNKLDLISKLTKTVKPFFTKPGMLTIKYMEGKRASYANPVRLYLIISLFYFLILSSVGKKIIKEGIDVNEESIEFTDEDKAALKEVLGNQNFAALDSLIVRKELQTEGQIDSVVWQSVKEVLADEKIAELKRLEKRALKKQKDDKYREIARQKADSLKKEGQTDPKAIVLKEEGKKERELSFFGSDFLTSVKWGEVKEKSKNLNLSENEILSEFRTEKMSDFEVHVLRQTIRYQRLGPEVMLGYAMKNLPLMMLILLPFFAGLLMLLYIRRKFFYIDHLIHSLHLHCFAYLIYGIALLLSYFIITNETLSGWVSFLAFIWVSLYAFLSFLRVYGQSKRKTFVKFTLQGFIYGTIILVAFVLELFISLLIY
jgi:hypothetical protein